MNGYLLVDLNGMVKMFQLNVLNAIVLIGIKRNATQLGLLRSPPQQVEVI
jgi:hypothetical protein